MTIRKFILAAALVAIAGGNAFALSTEYTEWAKGPVRYIFTEEELAAWKKVTTDAEAKAFVDLFWARRDPSPRTPENEYKVEFDKRVAFTDEKFTPVRKKGTKGSQTDRGMFIILFGPPTRIANQAGNAVRPELSSSPAGADDAMAYQVWYYEGDAAKTIFGVPKAEFRFSDKYGNQEYTYERAGGINIDTPKKRVLAGTITQPGLTKAPEFGAAAVAAPVAAAAAPMAITTPTIKSAVDEFKGATKNPYEKQLYATWGEFVTSAGETFVPVMLYVPKSAPFASQQNLTFFGEVQDASGNVVAAFEEPAKLNATKDDFFIDKSLPALPAGKHRGVFGLAADGKPVAMVSTTADFTGALDKDASAISPLILANNMYPLTEAQRAKDPFAFGGVKVVPKADKTFRKSEELWYFFELRNPGLSETGGPKIQVKLDLDGKTDAGQPVKAANPPAEVDAIEMKGVPGHFGVGNALTISGLDPGTYQFTIKVIDMVKKTNYTLTDSFRVVN